MKALERMLCVIVLVGIALFAGYSLLDKWAVDEFGIVRVWAVKRSLFSVKTLYYIGFAISAIIAVYIASKLNSVRMLAAVLGVIAVTPFCIWLYNYLGERYFNIVGKTFFYGATTGCAGWVLFSILSAPIGLIKRFAQESRDREERINTIKERNRQIDAETLSIVSDAKTKFEQGKFITVAGRSALAINVETGEQTWHQFAQAAGFEEPEEDGKMDTPADELFQQIYDNTAGMQNCPSFIVAGKKRSGKSTFLSWITRAYADEIDFVVYDPKLPDPTVNWGPTTTVIGQNQNFNAIADDIQYQLEEIQTLNVDPNRRKKIFIFDEWLTLIGLHKSKKDKELNPYGDRIFEFGNKILTELSYLGIGAIWSPHATTCTALGFKSGMGQLKGNFDGIFKFHYNLLTKVRKSFFEVDEEEFQLPLWNPNNTVRATHSGTQAFTQSGTHPKNGKKGPFIPISAACVNAEVDYLDTNDWRSDKPKKPRITRFYEGNEAKQHQFIVESYIAGKSKRAICEELDIEPSGPNMKKYINPILERYGANARV